jgi:5-methylcytosine-specific restriction enzyme A
MERTSPLDALRASVEAQRALEVVIGQQVRACRQAGISWNDIQDITGISKPTLMKRWRDPDMPSSTLNTISGEWDIEVGEVLRRRELHHRFGGSRMSGISPSRMSDNVLLFSGPAGEQYGYLDQENLDGTFTYFGEGQRSHQTMTRGNAAILQHAENGKHLRVFRAVGGGRVEYAGEYTYDTHRIVSGYDASRQQRDLIEFTLRPV